MGDKTGFCRASHNYANKSILNLIHQYFIESLSLNNLVQDLSPWVANNCVYAITNTPKAIALRLFT